MKNNSNLKVYFDLNEVSSMLKSHAFNCSMEAAKVVLNEFKAFITSYAPYSVVSDIATNYDYFLGDREHVDQLDALLNLNPVHLNDRLEKSSKLSLARGAFGIGFFYNRKQDEKIEAEKFIKVMDSIYKKLKYNCANGFDALARYLSFLFANRDITISQINELSSHMARRAVSLSYRTMGIVTMLATFCTSRKDLEHSLVIFYGEIRDLLKGTIDKVCRVEPKNQERVSFTNLLLLFKTLEGARYAEMEEAERPILFKTVLQDFLKPFCQLQTRKACDGLLPLDMVGEDDFSNVILFAQEVSDILELDK